MASRSRMTDWCVKIYSKTAGGFLFSNFNCKAASSVSAVKKAEKYIWDQGRLPRYYTFCAIEKNLNNGVTNDHN